MKSSIFYLSLCALIHLSNVIHAQVDLNSSGGNAIGGGGSVCYTIGQVVYTSHTGVTGSENQGIQQAYEITVVANSEGTLSFSISLYPNPTTTNLVLEVVNFNNENLSYRLTDLQGKTIESNNIKDAQHQLNTSEIKSSTYFLNILLNDKEIQSFKIIKN